jgi:hypothetical protein
MDRCNYKKVFRKARQQGWKVTISNGNHWKLVPPDPTRKILFTANSPSDYRAFRNFLADMKRNGFIP